MAEQPHRLDRLRAGRDIHRVFAARWHRGGRLAVVHAARRDDDGAPRVAVVASRRIGTAVARNRAKRLLREAARRIPWRDGIDVVLVARGPAAESRMPEVLADLEGSAERLGVVNGTRAA